MLCDSVTSRKQQSEKTSLILHTEGCLLVLQSPPTTELLKCLMRPVTHCKIIWPLHYMAKLIH